MVAQKFIILRFHRLWDEVVVWDSGFHIYKIDLFATILCSIHLKSLYNLLNIFQKGSITIYSMNYALLSWYEQWSPKVHGCRHDPVSSFCASHKRSDTTSAEVMQAEHILDNRTRPGSSDRRRTFQSRSRSLFSSSLLDARENATCVKDMDDVLLLGLARPDQADAKLRRVMTHQQHCQLNEEREAMDTHDLS
jgi:hypothetical protein